MAETTELIKLLADQIQVQGQQMEQATNYNCRCCNPTHMACLFVGCLISQHHACVSQGRICSDNFTCCHTDLEVADQTFHLTQLQYTDTGPTSPSTDPIGPGAWQGSHTHVAVPSLSFQTELIILCSLIKFKEHFSCLCQCFGTR